MPPKRTRKVSHTPPGAVMMQAAPVATQILIGLAVMWLAKRLKLG